MFRSEGEFRDIGRAVLGNHEDVVLAIAPGAIVPLGQHDHGLHGDHHAGLDDSVDVFAKLEAGLAPIIMAQTTERVTIAEGAVLEQIVVTEYIVEFRGDVSAACPGDDERDATPVHFAVDLP